MCLIPIVALHESMETCRSPTHNTATPPPSDGVVFVNMGNSLHNSSLKAFNYDAWLREKYFFLSQALIYTCHMYGSGKCFTLLRVGGNLLRETREIAHHEI